jgi:hypothetical protein
MTAAAAASPDATLLMLPLHILQRSPRMNEWTNDCMNEMQQQQQPPQPQQQLLQQPQAQQGTNPLCHCFSVMSMLQAPPLHHHATRNGSSISPPTTEQQTQPSCGSTACGVMRQGGGGINPSSRVSLG